MSFLITDPDLLKTTMRQIKPMEAPKQILMVTPDFFSVDYVINPHMEGQIGKVTKEKARWEWEVVRDKFRQFGLTVHELAGQPGLPDMVFSANQSLPIVDLEGHKHALMSIMHSEERKDEVPYFEQWYRQHGYEIHYPDANQISGFEGMGDATWHFNKRLLWGGYGYRTSREIYPYIAETFNIHVVPLELVHPSFYHLDTCFCVLNTHTVLIYPPAFTEEGLALIREGFSVVIEAPESEALKMFACNAACPDGRNVVIQRGCKEVNKALKKNSFAFHEVDTFEFLKSGGSVYCIKLMLW
ncbi:MAG: arginine deiminase-related protein [Balneolales bacterium]